MSSRFARIALYILVLTSAFFSLTQLQLQNFTDDPGVGWHLETGRYIAQSGHIPYTDPFLSISRPWISDQWLSDLFFYSIYENSGWPVLYALGIALYLSVFFLVLFKSVRSAGYASSASLIGLLIVSKLAAIHFIFRPVLLSFLLFSIIYAACVYIARRDNPSVTFKHVAISAICFVLWANLHPSFPLGLALLGMLVLSFVIDCFTKVMNRSSDATHGVLLVLLTSLVCTLINPYGYELHKSILSLSGNKFFMGLHQEWKPLALNSPEGDLFQIIIGIVATGIFIFGKDKLRISTFEFISTLLFAFAALTSVRFAPYFSIAAAPVLVAVLHEIRSLVIRSLTGNDPNHQHLRTRGEGALFLMFSLLLISYSLLWNRIPSFKGSYGPSSSAYPFGAIQFLALKEGERIIVYNHPNWGGFITRYGSGKVRAVLDDRNTLLGEEPYREFLESQSSTSNPVEAAKKHGAQYLLLRVQDTQKQCNPFGSSDVVYKDSLSVVAAIH